MLPSAYPSKLFISLWLYGGGWPTQARFWLEWEFTCGRWGLAQIRSASTITELAAPGFVLFEAWAPRIGGDALPHQW